MLTDVLNEMLMKCSSFHVDEVLIDILIKGQLRILIYTRLWMSLVQPCSQDLSSSRPPGARRRDPGWVWSRVFQNLGDDN